MPLKPLFYRRNMDDVCNRFRKYEFHEFFHAFNNYHENIKLTIEFSPSTKIPKHYKRSNITTDLHQTENVPSDMKEEIQTIRKRFIIADYPKPFVNSVINQSNNKT